MVERLLVPVYLPGWLRASLVKVKRVFIPPTPLGRVDRGANIRGERDVEWAFLSANMPIGSGEAIELRLRNGPDEPFRRTKGLSCACS